MRNQMATNGWNILYVTGSEFNVPEENEPILMKMASGRYYTGIYNRTSGFTTGVIDSLGETIVKWMYIPEDE